MDSKSQKATPNREQPGMVPHDQNLSFWEDQSYPTCLEDRGQPALYMTVSLKKEQQMKVKG